MWNGSRGVLQYDSQSQLVWQGAEFWWCECSLSSAEFAVEGHPFRLGHNAFQPSGYLKSLSFELACQDPSLNPFILGQYPVL